jgi:hypothetical protein
MVRRNKYDPKNCKIPAQPLDKVCRWSYRNGVTQLRKELAMSTNPVRVSAEVHAEIHAAARLFGCNAAELLQRAWESYRQTPEFQSDFELAQKAFAIGDLESIANRLHDESKARAKRRAAEVQALRQQ